MNNRLFLFLIVAAVLIGAASATLDNDKVISFYDFEGDLSDEGNASLTLTNSSANFTTGKLGNYALGTATNAYAYATSNVAMDISPELSICMWAKPNANNTNAYLFSRMGGANDRAYGVVNFRNGAGTDSSGYGGVYRNSADAFREVYSSTNTQSIGTWTHICTVYNGTASTITIYINGTSSGTSATADTIKTGITENWAVGAYSGNGVPSSFFSGSIDALMVYNGSLSSAEIAALYNDNGDPNALGVFGITASNAYTASSIATFNATYTFNGTEYFQSTTNGTIFTNITEDTGLINITVEAEEYFTNSTTNHNTSSDYAASLYAWTRIELYDIANTEYKTNFTAEINGTNYTTTTGNATIPLYNTTAEVTVYSAEVETITENLTASPYLENYTFYGYTTNTFNLTFYNETSNTQLTNITIYYQIISSVETRNGSTANGSIEETLLTPSDYEIVYYYDAERPREYYVTLTNGSYNTLRLYIIDEEISTTYIPLVTDENDRACSENTISLLRYYIDINGYRTVSMVRTDTNGYGLLYVEPNTINYKLYFEGSCGTFTSAPQKIISSTDSFTVTSGQTYLESPIAIKNANISLTYVNATQTYAFTWVDDSNTVTQGCLYVYKTYKGVQTTNYTQCSSSNTGSLIYTLTGNLTDTIWNAQGILTTNTAYSTYSFSADTVSFLSTVTSWGLTGVFWGMIALIGIVLLFGTTASSVVISTVAGFAILATFGIIAGVGTILTAILILGTIIIYKMRTL
jgi:hypothetical protein